MIREAIIKLTNKEDLTAAEARAVMDEIMSGEATPVQMSAYLTALSMKGETVEEITASAEGMRAAGTHLEHDVEVLEIVGTGGDRSNSFNISTTSSIIIAAAGVPVAKHGNRAASSKSGAADCLEALGVNIILEPEQNQKVLKDTGICFLHAQRYHSAMKFVGPIRKELGIRTVFNILGPLTNPAKATLQVMGVFAESLVEPMAEVLYNLGVHRGMVVYNRSCMDEIAACGVTAVCEINEGQFNTYTITPEQFGFKQCSKDALEGGTAEENAKITRAILSGEQGDRRNTVVMNAGAALYIAGKTATIEDGVQLAEKLIDDGSALKKLEEFIAATNQ